MKLASLKWKGEEKAGISIPGGWVLLETINQRFGLNCPADLLSLIETGALNILKDWFYGEGRQALANCEASLRLPGPIVFGPLYRRPRKIWGIGLNYKAHARDLSEKAPENEPASFMKPDSAIIGPLDPILIPRQSERTTAEAELGIIIGKQGRNVAQKDWLKWVAGFTTILDMTAEDILRRNPRYLTRAKSFDTFFSFGPLLITPEEIEEVMQLEVATVLNGEVRASDRVANMTFPPDFLVSFHSEVMTLLPGDIISSGTPGAAVIRHGDRVECRINGFEPLINPVKDLKTL